MLIERSFTVADRSEEKRMLILTKAKQIFISRGFNGVTMKDIIEECEISRGGIYLYFSSVDEIFTEVVNRHNQIKADEVKIDIGKHNNLEVMLDNFFDMQKNRLLHMENSLLLAMFEFFIAHKQEPDKDFFSGTFDVLENTILEILNVGVKAGHFKTKQARLLAANIMLCIKGLETQAMSFGVSEKQLDKQFSFYKKIILKKEGMR